jgi:hypothetical protein
LVHSQISCHKPSKAVYFVTLPGRTGTQLWAQLKWPKTGALPAADQKIEVMLQTEEVENGKSADVHNQPMEAWA